MEGIVAKNINHVRQLIILQKLSDHKNNCKNAEEKQNTSRRREQKNDRCKEKKNGIVASFLHIFPQEHTNGF